MQIDCPTQNTPASKRPALATALGQAVASSPATSIPRSLAKFVWRWVGPLAIALVLFEGVVRWFIYSPRPQVYDHLLGEMPAPGSTWVNGREGLGRIHWNRQGLRGRDLPAGKAGSIPRVIVMGDSFCEAESVNDSQTYCARLEEGLSHRLEQDIWVGNCGRPGLDAADFLYYLPDYERKLHPDLIVITYNLSDFRVSNHMIGGTMAQFDPAAAPGRGLVVQPLKESKEDALLDRYAPRPVARLGHRLIDHSGLALYGAARLYAMHWRKWPKDKFITHTDQIATVAQMERYFVAMIALSKTPIACAYVAPWNPLWESNNHWDAITEQRLRKATAQLKIPFVDSGPAFRRNFLRTGQPANGFANTVEGPGFGHLNAEGHRVVAESMAPSIASILAKRSRLSLLRVAQVRARAAALGASFPPPPRISDHRFLDAAVIPPSRGAAS
jgi:hypothetical protein